MRLYGTDLSSCATSARGRLSLQAKISTVDGEKEKRNNNADFNFHAIMHKRRCLILDGRPRWEVRYLRNLFDRDEQWEVNSLLATQASNSDGST